MLLRKDELSAIHAYIYICIYITSRAFSGLVSATQLPSFRAERVARSFE